MNGLIAVYDACVLVPVVLRDTLLRLAEDGVVRARYSKEIVEECIRALGGPIGLPPAALTLQRRWLLEGVPGVIVEGYEHLTPTIVLPDLKDRHVVAAAIHSGATVLVTYNVSDFPAAELDEHGIEVMHPDEFITNRISFAGVERIVAIVNEQAASTGRHGPRLSRDDILDFLEQRLNRNGAPSAAVSLLR